MCNYQSSQDWNDLEVAYAFRIKPHGQGTFQNHFISFLDVTTSNLLGIHHFQMCQVSSCTPRRMRIGMLTSVSVGGPGKMWWRVAKIGHGGDNKY